MSGEQKEPTDEEIERSFNEAANQLISNAALRARYVRKEKYDAVLTALAELIPIAERMQATCEDGESKCYDNEWDAADAIEYKAVIDRAKELLDKQPQSESDKTE